MSDPTILLGAVIDRRFEIDKVIGSGEKGSIVFRGHEIATGKPTAIRCPGVPADLVGLDYVQALDTFVTEAKLLARATEASDDVEQLLSYGIAEPAMLNHERERLPFCVFEWLEGKSLEQHMSERAGASQSIGEALAILEPAARGLAAAHSEGVTHKDVRPGSLWLANTDGRMRMKLTQFVLASRIGPSDDVFDPQYGAPEHFKRSYGIVGPQTDVYGLALCLVELISGKRALEGEDAAELYLATSDLGRRPTLRARGVQVSDAVEAVFARALAVDPKRRWQTARELWDALVSAVPELTPTAPSIRPREELPLLEPAEEAPKIQSRVPSMWAARDLSSGSLPADDARLGDSAKLPAFTPSAPPEDKDRAGRTAWALVLVVGIIAIGVVALSLRRAATMRSQRHAMAGAGSAGASATTPSLDGGPSTEVPARLQPFLADMILIPAGKFSMGNKDGKGDGPAHPVKITKPFYIDRTEVTAEMYSACIEDSVCTPNRVHVGEGAETDWGCNTTRDRPKHPVNCVDRVQAEKFCAYAQKRLPTEAEWEYAARGTDGRLYPWGNNVPTSCSMAVIVGLLGECRERKGTGEVGATLDGKSAFGVLDMAGNVWEWVADGHEPYAPGEVSDPRIATGGSGGGESDGGGAGTGVLRGGSWDYAPATAKATFRNPLVTTTATVSTGFRCARDGHE